MAKIVNFIDMQLQLLKIERNFLRKLLNEANYIAGNSDSILVNTDLYHLCTNKVELIGLQIKSLENNELINKCDTCKRANDTCDIPDYGDKPKIFQCSGYKEL